MDAPTERTPKLNDAQFNQVMSAVHNASVTAIIVADAATRLLNDRGVPSTHFTAALQAILPVRAPPAAAMLEAAQNRGRSPERRRRMRTISPRRGSSAPASHGDGRKRRKRNRSRSRSRASSRGRRTSGHSHASSGTRSSSSDPTACGERAPPRQMREQPPPPAATEQPPAPVPVAQEGRRNDASDRDVISDSSYVLRREREQAERDFSSMLHVVRTTAGGNIAAALDSSGVSMMDMRDRLDRKRYMLTNGGHARAYETSPYGIIVQPLLSLCVVLDVLIPSTDHMPFLPTLDGVTGEPVTSDGFYACVGRLDRRTKPGTSTYDPEWSSTVGGLGTAGLLHAVGRLLRNRPSRETNEFFVHCCQAGIVGAINTHNDQLLEAGASTAQLTALLGAGDAILGAVNKHAMGNYDAADFMVMMANAVSANYQVVLHRVEATPTEPLMSRPFDRVQPSSATLPRDDRPRQLHMAVLTWLDGAAKRSLAVGVYDAAAAHAAGPRDGPPPAPRGGDRRPSTVPRGPPPPPRSGR